jgi:aconitate hydratase
MVGSLAASSAGPFDRPLTVGDAAFRITSLAAAEAAGIGPLARLPIARKVLLENVLRYGGAEAEAAAMALVAPAAAGDAEIPFRPFRILMPDSSGLPLLADLAAVRDAVAAAGGDPLSVQPGVPLDLVVDHSAVIDHHGTPDALARNLDAEYRRNDERYRFLRWAEGAFSGLRVVPPGNGICHQVNLEYLASVVAVGEIDGRLAAFPDTLVGTDSHTPMVGGLGVLGWGVGGIEAATVMLGEPIGLALPRIVGCRLLGRLAPGVTTTDLVLTLTQRLRAHGVVGAIVEFCGPGLDHLSLPERATLCNMAPEYGATTGFVPIDSETIRFLAATGREPARVALVEAYARAQGLWRDPANEPAFDDLVELDLSAVEPSAAGPSRPQDRVPLSAVPASFRKLRPAAAPSSSNGSAPHEAADGDVVIAAITSCTNTSNPSVMVAAGLIARNAVARGLTAKPWVKTSLAPGSRVVADYLAESGLQAPLDALGFHVAGHGCTTCMGASGPLVPGVAEALAEHDRIGVAVLSGNRNFEGRIHASARANYLVSPPLVVAYAIAGNVLVDLTREPLGADRDGRPVHLRDIWPGEEEVAAVLARHLRPEMFRRRYASGFAGAERWDALTAAGCGATFAWDAASTYIRRPPFLDGAPLVAEPPGDIVGARPLLILGDGVTTDHISPVSAIPPASLAGCHLRAAGVAPGELSSYMARRVNDGVMVRGTFDHPRLANRMAPGWTGGFTTLMPDGAETTVFEAAETYRARGVPLVVVAGGQYGTGSSRDWAAKGTRLLGVRAVIAESFERIHRANLVGMGVLPLAFPAGTTASTLGLTGAELFDLHGIDAALEPGGRVACTIQRPDGSSVTVDLTCRIETSAEMAWFAAGGVLAAAWRRAAGRPAHCDGVANTMPLAN